MSLQFGMKFAVLVPTKVAVCMYVIHSFCNSIYYLIKRYDVPKNKKRRFRQYHIRRSSLYKCITYSPIRAHYKPSPPCAQNQLIDITDMPLVLPHFFTPTPLPPPKDTKSISLPTSGQKRRKVWAQANL